MKNVGKNSCETVKLAKGEMNVYDFGAVKMHAYKTNDFMDDEVFFFEKDGKVTTLEAPRFFDNYKELDDYFAERGLVVSAMLIAYHMCGGTWLDGAKKYATSNAIEYGLRGGGKALADQFAAAFGSIFDPAPHKITDVIGGGEIEINGIKYVITVTPDAFDVEIPEINAVYTHMLGHDCHSIVAGAGHADAIVAQLESYIEKGYNFILTSHYTPEDLKNAETKIVYIKDLREIAAKCADGGEFKTEVNRRYPGYSGGNYLDMTAGFFFGK